MKQQNKYLRLFQKPITTISTLIGEQSQFSLRWILLSRILLVIILFFLASQFITYQTVRSTLLETARENLIENVSRKTETLENSLKAIKSNLASVSQDYVLKYGDSYTISTLVINEAGTILAHPNGEKVGHNLQEEQDTSQLEAIIKNALAEDSEDFIHFHRNNQLLIAYATTTNPISTDNNSRLVILAVASLEEALSGIKEIQQVFLSAIACLIVVSIIVAINLIHTLAHPLEKLTDYAIGLNNTDTIQLQETPKKMKVKEFNKLAEALNNIAEKIKLLGQGLKETKIFRRFKKKLLITASEALRTHLNGIMGYLQLILNEAYDNREEEIEYLQQSFDCSLKFLGVLEDFFNMLQFKLLGQELDKELKETNILGESKTNLLAKTYKASRTHLNGIIGSLQLILGDFCDNREEEIEYLQQSFDCSLKLLAVLEEFFNVLQKEQEV